LCSVFEAPDAALVGRGARFDPVGGMQTHTGLLTRALDRRGIRHDVVTHRPPGAVARERLGEHAEVHRFGLPITFGRQLYSGPASVAAVRLAGRADIVHAHLGEDLAVLPIALAAARRASVPLVVTVHCSLRHTFSGAGARGWMLRRTGGRIERAACRRANMVIALTPRLASRLREDGVGAERLHVIPSGVVASEGADDPADPFPGVRRPRVVFVGRLCRQKGVHMLVEAATLLAAPDVAVVLVGDGPERRSLEESIRLRGLGDRVHVTGFLPHRRIPAVLRHADVFCMPSLYEELGTALLEAMHACVPIVASDTGGIPAAVGPAARLVPPGDAVALAGAIRTLLGDRREAARLAALGAGRVGEWTWNRLAAKVLAVYRLALEEPAPSAKAERALPAADRAVSANP
jgi:glycogen synthase